MRVVVVGASSGLGRSLGLGLAERGADVAFLARRTALVESAAAEAGGRSVAVTCDVTDEASCRQAVATSAEVLGGVDALLYCTGLGPLQRIEDIDAETWARVFATNVVGAAQVTRYALRHLVASGGTAAYLTSTSASLSDPWPGLASYTVTKAALDKLVNAWRAEHSDVAFTRVIVGECLGGAGDGATQFAAGWDQELAGELLGVWAGRGLLSDRHLEVGDLVRVVDSALRCGATATIPVVSVTPRRPLMG